MWHSSSAHAPSCAWSGSARNSTAWRASPASAAATVGGAVERDPPVPTAGRVGRAASSHGCRSAACRRPGRARPRAWRRTTGRSSSRSSLAAATSVVGGWCLRGEVLVVEPLDELRQAAQPLDRIRPVGAADGGEQVEPRRTGVVPEAGIGVVAACHHGNTLTRYVERVHDVTHQLVTWRWIDEPAHGPAVRAAVEHRLHRRHASAPATMPAFALTLWRFLLAAALLALGRRRDQGAVAADAAGRGATSSSPGCCCRACSSAPATPRSRWACRPRSRRWCCACAPVLVAVGVAGRCWANGSAGSASWAPRWPSLGALVAGVSHLDDGGSVAGFALLARRAGRLRGRHALPEEARRDDGPAHRHRGAAARRRRRRRCPSRCSSTAACRCPPPPLGAGALAWLGDRQLGRRPCCCCSCCCAAAPARA